MYVSAGPVDTRDQSGPGGGEDQAEGEAVARALLLGATQLSGDPGSLVFQA